MDKDPAYDRQGYREAETAGKKPSGGCRIKAGGNQGNHIQGNEQNDADKRGDLLRGLFFHRIPHFCARFYCADPYLGCEFVSARTLYPIL